MNNLRQIYVGDVSLRDDNEGIIPMPTGYGSIVPNGCPTPPAGVSWGTNCWFNGWHLHDSSNIELHNLPNISGQIFALGYAKNWRIFYCPSYGPRDLFGMLGSYGYLNHWGPGAGVFVNTPYSLWNRPQKINFQNPAERVYAFDSAGSVGNGPSRHGDNYFNVMYHDGHVRSWIDRLNVIVTLPARSNIQFTAIENSP